MDYSPSTSQKHNEINRTSRIKTLKSHEYGIFNDIAISDNSDVVQKTTEPYHERQQSLTMKGNRRSHTMKGNRRSHTMKGNRATL